MILNLLIIIVFIISVDLLSSETYQQSKYIIYKQLFAFNKKYSSHTQRTVSKQSIMDDIFWTIWRGNCLYNIIRTKVNYKIQLEQKKKVPLKSTKV